MLLNIMENNGVIRNIAKPQLEFKIIPKYELNIKVYPFVRER
jgi:hypothetical protein